MFVYSLFLEFSRDVKTACSFELIYKGTGVCFQGAVTSNLVLFPSEIMQLENLEFSEDATPYRLAIG